MVAIRPTPVQGQEGQKFIVTKRFSGDGYDFTIGDVIVAHKEWVHKVPMLVDQHFISPYLSAEDQDKAPVNAIVNYGTEEVETEQTSDLEQTNEEDSKVQTVGEGDPNIDENEINNLANSLIQ